MIHLKNAVKVLFFAVICAGSTLEGAWSKDGEYPWDKMGESVITPHRKIYKPIHGKKPKIFYMGFQKGMREIAEFRQRYESDLLYWPLARYNQFSPYEPRAKRMAYAVSMDENDYVAERKRIFGQLNSCDVLLIGKVVYTTIPADIRKKMLDRVKSGASMILVLRDRDLPKMPGIKFAKRALPANIPFAAIPELSKTQLYTAKHGAGRIILVDYQDNVQRSSLENIVPADSENPLYYEYNYAFLGALVRELTAKNIPVLTLNKNGATVTGSIPSGAKLRLDYVDQFGKVIKTQSIKAKKGLNRITVPADLPASVRMQDAFLTDAAGKVINYAARQVISPRKNKIASVKLDKDITGKDRVLTGAVTMTGAPKGNLFFEAVDHEGRVIFRKTMKAAAGKNAFRFQFAPFENLSAFLTVKYMEQGKLADEKGVYVYFPLNRADVQNDFMFVMWEGGTRKSPVIRQVVRSMKEAGVDVIMETGLMDYHARTPFVMRNFHRAGMATAIYLTRLVGTHKYQRLCNMSLADEIKKTKSFRDKKGRLLSVSHRRVEGVVPEASKFGVAFYNLGDENALADDTTTEYCHCKECNVRFRKHLKQKFGTVANLNKQCNVNYKSFEDVKTITLEAAAENDKLSLWLVFRHFMDSSYIDWHRSILDHIRVYDKVSPIGIEGMQYPEKSAAGFNLAEMLPMFDFCAPYIMPRDMHALQYLKPGALKSAWYGTYEGLMSTQYVRQTPWRYLFCGLGGAFYWYAGNPGYSNATIYRMDLGFLSQFSETAAEIRGMRKSGIAKLIMDSKKLNNRIAVHYSQSCLHAATMNPDQTTWEISINNMGSFIEATGMDYKYVTPAEITSGKLKDFKALFLPYSQAISDAEAKAMKEFVRNGGVIFADYNPGIMTEHGKMRKKSVLSDLFGAIGKMNVKKYGKGYAICVHDQFDGAAQRAEKGNASGLIRGMLRMLKQYAKVEPPATVYSGEQILASYGCFTNDGTDLYLTFLGQMTHAQEKAKSKAGAEGNVRVNVVSGKQMRTLILKEPAYVYDLNKGKAIGKVKKYTFELEPALGRVIAVCKKPAPVPTVKGPAATTYAKPAKFTISGVKNPCHVTVTAPNGRIVYEKNIKANGSFQYIPSYELPAGTFKVAVKNIVGGKTRTLKLNVK